MTVTSELDLLNNPDDGWSVSPVSGTNDDATFDRSFVITRGIVYKVSNKGKLTFQVGDNHTKNLAGVQVDISFHGDENGAWVTLDNQSLVSITGDFFLLNRSKHTNIAIIVL